MKLLTAELMKKIPFDVSNESNPKALVKFFNPTGAGTWYGAEAKVITPDGDEKPLSEFKPADLDDPAKVEDVIFFGAAEIFEFELGSFSYRELRSFRGRFGLPIERDRSFSPVGLKEAKGK